MPISATQVSILIQRIGFAAIILGSPVVVFIACGEKSDSLSAAEPIGTASEFVKEIRELEKMRDAIVEDYQVVTANFGDMRTQEVFDRADKMGDDLRVLRRKLAALTGPPSTASLKRLLLEAYDTELEGYEAFADEVRLGLEEAIRPSIGRVRDACRDQPQ